MTSIIDNFLTAGLGTGKSVCLDHSIVADILWQSGKGRQGRLFG